MQSATVTQETSGPDLTAIEHVLLGMLITYYSETEPDRQRKIMESHCQLAFWLWGWNVTSFYVRFQALRDKLVGHCARYQLGVSNASLVIVKTV